VLVVKGRMREGMNERMKEERKRQKNQKTA
jgi:hypothetical protein